MPSFQPERPRRTHKPVSGAGIGASPSRGAQSPRSPWRIRTARGLASLLTVVIVGCNDEVVPAPRDTLQQVHALQASGRFEETMDPLRELLLSEPDHIPARLMLARAYLERQDGDNADSHIRRAIKMGADPGAVKAMRVHALVLQKAYGEAIGMLQPGDMEAGDADLLLPAAQAYLGERRLDEARALFERTLESAGHRPAAHAGLFETAMLGGDYQAAESHLGQLPQDLDSTRHFEGRLALARKQLQRAVNVYRHLMSRNPEDENASLGLVQAKLAMGDQDVARSVLEPMLERDPESTDAHYLLAVTEYLDGNLRAALEQVRDTLSRAPSHGPALRLFGLLNLKLGYSEQAVEALNGYLADNPADAETRKLLVAVLLQLGHSYEADELLFGFDEPGEDPTILALRGLSHLQHGNYLAAIELLGEAATHTDRPGLHGEVAVSHQGLTAVGGDDVLSGLTRQEGARQLSQLVDAGGGDEQAQSTDLVMEVVQTPGATAELLALAKHAVERDDRVEACALYARVLDHGEHDAARQGFAALDCEERYGTVEQLLVRAPGEGLAEPPVLSPPRARARMGEIIQRLRASLDGEGSPAAAQTKTTLISAPPSGPGAMTERLVGELSTELLSHVVSTQVTVVGQAKATGSQQVHPLHLIPPELKERLREMRDRLPTWVRALNDGPEGRLAPAPEGEALAIGGAAGIDLEPATTRSELNLLGEAFNGVSRSIAWLGDTVREHQLLVLLLAVPVILALFLRDMLGHRRRPSPGSAPRQRPRSSRAPPPRRTEATKPTRKSRHRRRRYTDKGT